MFAQHAHVAQLPMYKDKHMRIPAAYQRRVQMLDRCRAGAALTTAHRLKQTQILLSPNSDPDQL